MPAGMTMTATMDAGTVASLTGTVRPASPTIQRGNTSPQRWIRPSVRMPPTVAKQASPRPAQTAPLSMSSPSSCERRPSGMCSTQANRVAAYTIGTAAAM